jgi:uncharacterized protein YcbK (DUF882 family)
MTTQQGGPLGSAIETGRGLQRLHQGGNKKADCHGFARGFLLAGMAIALSGCVSAGDPAMFTSVQGFAPDAQGLADTGATAQIGDGVSYGPTETAAASGIPLPTPSPTAVDAAAPLPLTQSAQAQPIVMASTGVDALNRGITQSLPNQTGANIYAATAPQPLAADVAASTPPTAEAPAGTPPATAMAAAQDQPAQTEAPQIRELAVVAPPKKQSIFSRLFAPQATAKRNAPSGATKRLIQPEPTRVAMASSTGSLPGVRLSSVLGTDSGNAETRTGSGNIELASAAGLARLAPNGLHIQTDRVEIDCFKPQLVRVLKTVERHYGRPVVVTSGYRSPKHNRRIGGASGSRHTSCEAADIQIDGVSKWQLAKYLRSMPDRGGVGTYCHTESVHIDVGNPRDWNWRCRRRK